MRAIWYPLMYVCGALNVINWKLIGINYLCSFISFPLVSNSFFFFLKKTFESILLSLIQKSKIKINPIYLIQSIYHLWCVLNTDTIGFSVTENLWIIYQPRSPIYRCRPCMDFLFIIEKKYQQPSNIAHIAGSRFQLIPTIWSQREQV